MCFTETPLEHIHILTSKIDGRECQFQPYGIAISKKQGRKYGANPVWYLDITPGHNWLTNPVNTMVDAAIVTGNYAAQPIARLTPFIEQMGIGVRTSDGEKYRKEFWWEREWRYQGNFNIAGRPMIICPSIDHEEIKLALDRQPRKLIVNPSLIDPNWSLEQIIGHLAGFSLDDLGAF